MSKPAALWRNRNFRLLFTATAISNLGDGVALVAYPWLATLISKDPMDIAFVAFASRLPWFLFALPAGVITDRVAHKKLMVGADVFRALLTLCVVALVFWMPSSGAILLLAIAAFMLGAAEVLRDNTAQTILPQLVDGEDLPKANGTLWSAEQIIGEFVGPPLAGFLIALALPLPFLLDAVSFAVAAGLVWRLRPRPMPAARQAPAFAAMKEGMLWVWQHKLIFRLAMVTGFLNFSWAVALTILVLFSQDVFGLGALEYGFIVSFGAVGGGLGGVLAPRIVKRIGQSWALRIAVTLAGAQMLIIAVAAHATWLGFALFLGAFGSLLWNVVAVPLRQRAAPSALLGRVNSVYRFISWGIIPLGALAAGIMVKGFGQFTSYETALRAPYFVLAGLYILTVFYVFKALRIPSSGLAGVRK